MSRREPLITKPDSPEKEPAAPSTRLTVRLMPSMQIEPLAAM